MTFKSIIILFTGCACFQFTAWAQEIKFSDYIEPIKDPNQAEEAKPAKKAPPKKVGFPLRFGMSSKEVVNLVGDPTGIVKVTEKETYSYPNGFVEFEHDAITKMKWDGKYYSQQSKPEFARETAGVIEIKKSARPRASKVIKARGKQSLGTAKGPAPKIRVIKGSASSE